MTNKTTSAIDLVERLRRTEKRKSYFAPNATAPIIESEYDAPINPDGPEAADAIERLEAEKRMLVATLGNVKRVIVDEPFFSTDPELSDLCAEVESVMSALERTQ